MLTIFDGFPRLNDLNKKYQILVSEERYSVLFLSKYHLN